MLSFRSNNAEVVKLADALDSKSSGSDTVRVQVPPSAPKGFDANIKVVSNPFFNQELCGAWHGERNRIIS